jgi:hypothetical protein
MTGRKKSSAVPSEFSFEHEGESLEFSKYISKVIGRVAVILVPRFDVAVCPICLAADPEVAEHVPPESLGGKIMTLTCDRCNHDFGTAEDQLRRFVDLEATAHIQATDDLVRGTRSATVALRSSEGRPTGAFVRSSAPQFDDILNSGSGELTVKPLDMPLVAAAALKHAYLAACLCNREIPTTDEADRVRAVLLAVRDRNRESLMGALIALGFEPTFGWIETPGIPPILLLETENDDDLHWVFLLGGRFILQWPFKDVAPVVAGRPVGTRGPLN